MAARKAFYCGLAAIIVPPIGWLGGLLAWWMLWRAQRDDEERRWRRRLGYLLGFDALVLAILVAASAAMLMRGDVERVAQSRNRHQPQIGLVPELAKADRGVRVASVSRASPAEQAGLRRGDLILRVDDEDIATSAALIEAIRTSTPDHAIEMQIERAGEAQTLSVTPTLVLPSPGRWDVEDRTCGLHTPTLVSLMLALLAAAAVAFTWNGRNLLVPGAIGVFGAMAGANAVSSATLHALCQRLGGHARGSTLLTSGLGELVMLGMAITLFVALRRKGLQLTPIEHRPEGQALGLGALFTFAVHIRWSFLFASAYFFSGTQPAAFPIEAFISMPVGIGERLWVALIAAVMAPIAEECLFRGVLLSGLARHMRPYYALAISSAVFGLIHVPSHGVTALVTAGYGGALGWVRLHTKDLRTCIALHACINATALTLHWL